MFVMDIITQPAEQRLRIRDVVGYAGATATCWVALIVLFGGFSYVDAVRAGAGSGFFKMVGLYALGFAPWLVLGPAVFLFAGRQAFKEQRILLHAAEVLLALAATFGVIFAYFLMIYAPLKGMTASEAVSHTRLVEWVSDILLFIIVFLAGWQVGTPHHQTRNAPAPRIAVRSQGRVDYVRVEEIVAGSARGNYVALFTNDREYLYRGSISDLAQQLEPFGVVRVHRSHFLRPDYVVAVTTKGAAIREACLANGSASPVSSQYEQAFRAALSDSVVYSG